MPLQTLCPCTSACPYAALQLAALHYSAGKVSDLPIRSAFMIDPVDNTRWACLAKWLAGGLATQDCLVLPEIAMDSCVHTRPQPVAMQMPVVWF